MKKKFILFLIFTCLAREEDKFPYIPNGNLALPTSQQPSPLFCFGQNIVDKGDFQAFGYTDYKHGCQAQLNEVLPNIFYGITDDLMLYIALPIAAKFKVGNQCRSQLEDLVLQVEYAFYNKDRPTYANQATVVVNMTLPTGRSSIIVPNTYFMPSFFLGFTFSHTGHDWYVFASPGANVTLPHNNTRYGDIFYYEAGIGHNLYYISNKLIITLMAEFFGSFHRADKLRGVIQPNSRGNNFFIGPSLWIATERFIFESGIAFPVTHNSQNLGRHDYFFAAEIGWKFNS